jgi:BlaI family penicillinase repressor
METSALSHFTPGEMTIMRLLWAHGELKPGDLQRLHPEPIKNPALRSYLTILLTKGHVSRRKVGKAYFYNAVTPHQSAFRSNLRDLINSFCAGSTQTLLLNLIRSEALSETELLKLKQLADEEASPPNIKPRPSGVQSGKGRRNEFPGKLADRNWV